MQKIPYEFQEVASKTLIYQEYSTTIARRKHPRDSDILPSNRQVISIYNSTRERERYWFAQVGRKFQPRGM
jgi:hypothetical protein